MGAIHSLEPLVGFNPTGCGSILVFDVRYGWLHHCLRLQGVETIAYFLLLLPESLLRDVSFQMFALVVVTFGDD